MAELIRFPVRKFWDESKKKWQKVPAIPKGVSWLEHRASEDELEAADNVGIVPPKGFVLIDLDTHKNAGLFDDLQDRLGGEVDWQGAELQKTVSGGSHYLFRLPEGVEVRQGSDLIGLKGFDTRTAGKGWFCTGDGYEDLTLFGIVVTLTECPETFPELPVGVCRIINGDSGKAAPIEGELIRSAFDDLDDEDDPCSLEQALAEQPLDGIGLEEIKLYLSKLPVADLESYDTWFKAGVAVHHQTSGSEEGLEIWIDWSRGSSWFDERECRSKWHGFANRESVSKPARFDYVIGRAGGRLVIVESKYDRLRDQARAITDITEYERFKKHLRGIPLNELSRDLRGMLAQQVFEVWGKGVGLTKSDIKAELTVSGKKKKALDIFEGVAGPDWVKDWVYSEVTCEFYNHKLAYGVKKEAFNAKYDRMVECLDSETQASAFALNQCRIPTVVDKMYWPGADTFFDFEGKLMVNEYRPFGLAPVDRIDDDGQKVIDQLLDHVAWLIDDEREQRILLDWIAFVIQNPGKKVNWAILLQGIRGIGKSYFVSLMEAMMGRGVSILEPTAIKERFTGWAYGSRVVAIEEVRISGANRFEIMDKLKPYVSNATIPIEQKNRDGRTVPNFTSYFMLTNHKDALPLDDDERRYCPIFCRIKDKHQMFDERGGEQEAADYFDDLFANLSLYPGVFLRWFLDREIGAEFNASGRAPETKWKQLMTSISVSDEQDELDDMIEEHRCPIINDLFVDVTHLRALVEGSGREFMKTRRLSTKLLEMGYQPIDKRRKKINGAYHYIWVKDGVDGWENAIKAFFKDDFDEFDIPF